MAIYFQLRPVYLLAGIVLVFGQSLTISASANGNKAKLGVIETSDEGPPEFPKGSNIGIELYTLTERLKGEFNFGMLNPGQMPLTITHPPTEGNEHATNVAILAAQGNLADIFFGGLGTTGTGTIPIYNAFRASTDYLYRDRGVGLFNLSDWIEGDPPPNTGAESGLNNNGKDNSAKFIDWFSLMNNVLLVKSAGNNGRANGIARNQISNPGDAYNVITVGATDDNVTRANYSSYWLRETKEVDGKEIVIAKDNGTAPDIRGKPDILALGTPPPSAPNPARSGTSYAAPRVTAAAAWLWEQGLTLGSQSEQSHLAHKAIILNSARKRNINPPKNGQPNSMDRSTEASDQDYLGNGLTLQWTPTQWEKQQDKLIVKKPLDDEQGTGIFDFDRVMEQYKGGRQRGNVTPIGWDISPVVQDVPLDYVLDFKIEPGTFITTTLTWDRIVGCTRSSMTCDSTVQTDDRYEVSSLPDLDLFIYFKDKIVAESISSDENVEHLHFPVKEFGNEGDYKIQIRNLSTTALTDYGLAWWTKPCVTPQPEPKQSKSSSFSTEDSCSVCGPCQRVPEPSNALSLIALGLFSLGSGIVRRNLERKNTLESV